MGVNIVTLGNETLIDLTQDTVQANKLASGLTAHDASGTIITGSLQLNSTLVDTNTHIVVPPNSTWEHLDIYGVTGGVTGKNLFNRDTCVQGYYISATGNFSKDTGNPSMYTQLIPVDPNQTYTFSGICVIVGNKRIHGYDETGHWVQQINFINQNTLSLGQNMLCSVTIPDTGIVYVRISCSNPDEDLQFEKGSVKTAYESFGAGAYLNVDSYQGVNKFSIYLDLNAHPLDDSGYSPNVLSIDNSGNVTITVFSEASYEVYTLNSINIPTISARDRMYIDGPTHPILKYTYTIEGTEAVVPEGSLTIFENGTYDISTYASVTVSV